MQPLLKWPGGKRALLPQILGYFPDRCRTYFEPFFGGGAAFFAVQPPNAVLSDTNAELINCYLQVRDNPDELIRLLNSYKNSADDYYRVRASRPRLPLTRAARLMYLARLAFNGIHRVNLEGVFNVPYGGRTHLQPFEEEHVIQASYALQGATLLACDFEEATMDAKSGDVVYFDPPYTVAHAKNGFLKYNERIFSWEDQERLAVHARALGQRGCTVVVSNADHPSVRKLYSGFKRVTINRFSRIAATPKHRREITELLFMFE